MQKNMLMCRNALAVQQYLQIDRVPQADEQVKVRRKGTSSTACNVLLLVVVEHVLSGQKLACCLPQCLALVISHFQNSLNACVHTALLELHVVCTGYVRKG